MTHEGRRADHGAAPRPGMAADPGASLQPASAGAVRPLFVFQHRPMARAGEVLAETFPQQCPAPPVLGLAVLKDLAWLCAYFEELAEETRAFEPARESLLAFIHRRAPRMAAERPRVSVPDEPLRWGFRIRVAPELGDMLTRLLRSVFAFSDLVDAVGGRVPEASLPTVAALGEIDLAIAQVPVWRPRLLAIRALISGARPVRVPG